MAPHDIDKQGSLGSKLLKSLRFKSDGAFLSKLRLNEGSKGIAVVLERRQAPPRS
jgi:hypothetical protein